MTLKRGNKWPVGLKNSKATINPQNNNEEFLIASWYHEEIDNNPQRINNLVNVVGKKINFLQSKKVGKNLEKRVQMFLEN